MIVNLTHSGEIFQKFKNEKCPKSKTKKISLNNNLELPLTSANKKFLRQTVWKI